jgi:4-diphosphocytidyl-2-C-methyl-D-erythritol kinase
MHPLEIHTAAKVNLVLDVLAVRPDGYHEIRSLMMKVGLYDDLLVEPADKGVIAIECDDPAVPTDDRNLVFRAAQLLARKMGRIPGCRVQLRKRIPVGGGMGGGSSNAAGALRVLNASWGCGLADGELAALASELGSDVPFFFAPTCAIVSGRGDCVESVHLSFDGWVVLVLGGVHVSTAQVYGACTSRSPESCLDNLSELTQARSAAALRAGLRNELEPAVFQVAPPVRELFERVRSACGRPMRISGAGAVLFDVFDTQQEACGFAESLRSQGISQEVRVVRGPVADWTS